MPKNIAFSGQKTVKNDDKTKLGHFSSIIDIERKSRRHFYFRKDKRQNINIFFPQSVFSNIVDWTEHRQNFDKKSIKKFIFDQNR